MKLTGEDARQIVWEDHPEWEKERGTESIIDHSRWAVQYTAVFKHIPTAKFYRAYWSKGATEMQEESPYEYATEVEFTEVEKIKKEMEVWEPVTR